MPKKIQKIYWIWSAQIARCNNSKHKRFKTYGAKGIRVEYTAKEFIGWFQEAIKNCPFKEPHVGRIDHSKNYSFDNIELQTARDNALEVHARYGGTNAKLNKQKAEEIRELLKKGQLTQTAIAAKFGVHHSLITYIKNDKIWCKN